MHGDGPTQGLGAKGTRGARTRNMMLMSVTLEVSKFSGWLKADADCRVEGRACDAGKERCEPGGGRACVGWWRHTRGMHGDGPTQGLGSKGTRGERTRNIWLMVVTLEVSQPEMSALKLAKSRKRELMSVMAETSQSAMGPYVSMAAVGLALYAWTAVTSGALVVKV